MVSTLVEEGSGRLHRRLDVDGGPTFAVKRADVCGGRISRDDAFFPHTARIVVSICVNVNAFALQLVEFHTVHLFHFCLQAGLAGTGLALLDAVEEQGSDQDGGDDASGYIHGDSGSGRQVVPFVRCRQLGGLMEGLVEGGVLVGAVHRLSVTWKKKGGSVQQCNLPSNLDAFVGTTHIAVRVLGATAVVGDASTLDIHGEGALGVVGVATSPLTSAVGHSRVTASPDTERESHGGLGVVSGLVGLLGGEGTDEVAVNVPLERVLGPDGGVVDEVLLVVGGGVQTGVVEILNTLAKVVGRGHGVVDAQELQVDFVEIVAQPHGGADNADSGGDLEEELDAAEEEVEERADGGRVALLVDGEAGAIFAVVGDGSSSRLPQLIRRRGVEVEEVVGIEAGVGRACRVQRVARRGNLG